MTPPPTTQIARLIRQCPIDIYSASGGGQGSRYHYPFKLQSVRRASESVRDTCHVYIVDSGISDPSITNEGVIEAARGYDATYVIPKDYLNDRRRTPESVLKFLRLYQAADCQATPLIPSSHRMTRTTCVTKDIATTRWGNLGMPAGSAAGVHPALS